MRNRNKVFLGIMIVGLIWLVVSVCRSVNDIFTVKPTQTPIFKAEAITATPEMLIAPKQPVPTVFITPTSFIHTRGNLATPTSATVCRIKGNVSWRNNDEKIYHCPNWRDYDRTQVNWHDGDRWFCTEAEAIEAGFRKPENVTVPCIP